MTTQIPYNIIKCCSEINGWLWGEEINRMGYSWYLKKRGIDVGKISEMNKELKEIAFAVMDSPLYKEKVVEQGLKLSIKKTNTNETKEIGTLERFLERLHLGEYKDIGQALSHPISKHVLDTPLMKLPNVSSVKIDVQPMNSVWSALGFKKRNNPVIEWESGNNTWANHYMHRQVKRLYKLRASPKEFWRLAMFLLINSRAFQVSILHKLDINWHRKWSYNQVVKIIVKGVEIWKNKDVNLKLKRVLIDKNDKEYRPLGVPSIEWRYALSGLNVMLYIFLRKSLLDSQHGYITNKGVMSCWKEMFNSKLLDSKYIYEVDLRRFFDRINIERFREYLWKEGVPGDIVGWIYGINHSSPEWSETNKKDKNWEEFYTADKKYREVINSEINFETMFDKFVKERGNNGKDMYELNEEFYEFYMNYYDSLNHDNIGVPQGSTTGPLIANWFASKFYGQGKSISYADDGIFFSDKPIELKEDLSYGIEINEKKSGYVKEDGKWIKPLKFLGFIYDGNENTISACTRSGKINTLSNSQLEAIKAGICAEIPIYKSLNTWELVHKSKYTGWVHNILTNGINQEIEQVFKYTFLPTSLSNMMKETERAFPVKTGDRIEDLRQALIEESEGKIFKCPQFVNGTRLDRFLDLRNSSSYACEFLMADLRLAANQYKYYKDYWWKSKLVKRAVSKKYLTKYSKLMNETTALDTF